MSEELSSVMPGISNYQLVMDKLREQMDKLGHVNLLLVGKSGVGKSTLVNAVFRKKMADTGVGRPVTQRTDLYQMPGFPLRIYDTKGLELDQQAQEETLNEIENTIHRCAAIGDPDQRIHVIWYCINAQSARLEEAEERLIRQFCTRFGSWTNAAWDSS